MKQVFAYYLLLLYIIAICKPVLPAVKDAMAHSFWRAEHLTTVHLHGGDHHVHNEIKEIATHNEENRNTPLLKSSEPVSIHLVSKNSYDFTYQFIIAKNETLKFYNLQSPFLDISSPPPKI